MLSRSVVLLVIAALLLPVAAGSRSIDQTKEAVTHWIRQNYEAAERYRSGDLDGALQLLAAMTKGQQEKALSWIRAYVEAVAAGSPPAPNVVQWTPRVLRALAALQMEAAIVARNSSDRDADDIADHHIALAINTFEAAAALTGEEDDVAARWILAIGLERMAQAEFAAAYRILSPYCDEKQTNAALLVACGTIHESLASFAIQIRTGPGVPSPFVYGGTLAQSVEVRNRARAARKEQIEHARKYFERALALDSTNTESLLRLSQVRMHQKDDRGSAELLEKLIARPSLDQRQRYLAKLFLARIRDRQNRLEDAAALLAQTSTHQSSLIARAHNAQRRGDAREAAAYVEQAALLGTDDPWWGYRYGQYWLPESLFKQLREEARK